MTQVEAHGAAKLRQCACASPVALVNTLPDAVLNHVEVLHRNEPRQPNLRALSSIRSSE